MDHFCYFCHVFVMFCARLFINALWSRCLFYFIIKFSKKLYQANNVHRATVLSKEIDSLSLNDII